MRDLLRFVKVCLSLLSSEVPAVALPGTMFGDRIEELTILWPIVLQSIEHLALARDRE